MPRLLLWLTVAFATGTALGRSWPADLPESCICAVSFLLTTCLIAGLHEKMSLFRRPFFVLTVFFVLGTWAGRSTVPLAPSGSTLYPFMDRGRPLLVGEVASPPDFTSDRIRIPVQVKSILDEHRAFPAEGGVLLTMTRSSAIPGSWLPGDRILLRPFLKSFHNFSNPGGFDYVKSQAEKGLHARAFLPDDRFVVRLCPESRGFLYAPGRYLRRAIESFRQKALLRIEGALEPDSAAFYAALLLGYQNLLSRPLQDRINRVGVTHLLSISGLHLGMVSIFAFWAACRLVRLLRPDILQGTSDRQIAVWPAFIAAAGYAFVSGFLLPPIWRSLIMLALLLGALYGQRMADSLSILAAAAFIILLLEPGSLRQISFQLSFACMLAILVLYPRLKPWTLSRVHSTPAGDGIAGKLVHPFEEAFRVSLAVNIFVLPLTVYYFKGISLAGFVANIFLVPLVGFLVLPAGLASLALATVSEFPAWVALKIGAWFLSIAEAIIQWFSELSWAFFWVGTVPPLFLPAFYVGLWLLLNPWRWKIKAACLGMLVLLVSAASTMQSAVAERSHEDSLLRVDVIDVGQGTSTLVRFPGSVNMLVDGGGFFDDSFDIGRSVVAPCLWNLGVRKLDHVILSHDHPDHRNGLRFILSHFRVGCFWTTEVPTGSTELEAVALRRSIPVRTLPDSSPDTTIGHARIRVIHPDSAYLRDSWDGDLNNASVVLEVEYGNTRLVLPGDIDGAVERRLFRGAAPQGGTLLVAPHHGSEASCTGAMLDHYRPVAVIFSCGYDNRFGFPSQGVLDRCTRRGIPHFRTDLHGLIHAVSDGQQWNIVPYIRK